MTHPGPGPGITDININTQQQQQQQQQQGEPARSTGTRSLYILMSLLILVRLQLQQALLRLRRPYSNSNSVSLSSFNMTKTKLILIHMHMASLQLSLQLQDSLNSTAGLCRWIFLPHKTYIRVSSWLANRVNLKEESWDTCMLKHFAEAEDRRASAWLAMPHCHAGAEVEGWRVENRERLNARGTATFRAGRYMLWLSMIRACLVTVIVIVIILIVIVPSKAKH